MTHQRQNSVAQTSAYCLTVEGLIQLFFLAFGLGFLFIVAFSFLLDYWFAYPMCEICLLQRFIMSLVVVSSLIGGLASLYSMRIAIVFMVVIGFLVGLGLAFSVAHLHMMQQVLPGDVNACQIVSEMTFMPDFWADFFHSRYAFVPCDQVKSGFLGLSFPFWSLMIYGSSAVVFSVVVYLAASHFGSRSIVLRIRQARWYAWFRFLFGFLLVILFCVWISTSIYVIANQRKIFYRPERYTQAHLALLEQVQQLDYTLEVGDQHAYEYPSTLFRDRPQRVQNETDVRNLWIIMSGRDAMALDGFVGHAGWRDFLQTVAHDASVLLVDYPGFGANDGLPTERLNRDSVVSAYRSWRQRHGLSAETPCRVFLLAHSMGTGVAVDVARSLPDISGVVLLSPFASVHKMNMVVLGRWMAWTIWPFVWDRYPTAERLSEFHQRLPNVPLAIFHGDQDIVIPVEHSQEMVSQNQWIDYYQRAGAGHNKNDFVGDELLGVMQRMMQDG